jgi:hypothetical protein
MTTPSDRRESRRRLSDRDLERTVLRLDHAVFGLDDDDGLLDTMHLLNTKLDRLYHSILLGTLTLAGSTIAAVIAFSVHP